MNIPRSYIDGFADSLEKLSDEMKRRLAKDLEKIDWEAPVADVRNQLIAVMQVYCGESADTASMLAAEFYDGLREMELGERIGAVSTGGAYSDEAVDGFVRSAVQPLAENGLDAVPQVISLLTSRVGYETKSAAGETIFMNGERDSKKVRFARVPRGSKSYPHGCPFCIMLASRGFVYRSKGTAGEMSHYHDGCQCMIVPGFGDNPYVEGYNPDEYYDRWKHPEKYADEPREVIETEQQQDDFKPLINRPYSGASSIKEASERAEQFVNMSGYKAKVDLGGMSVDAANSLLKSLEAVYDSYDVDPLRSIQRMNKRSNQFKNTSAEAAYQWMIGDLFYNADYVRTAKAMAAHRAEGRKLLGDVLGMDLDGYIRKNAGNVRKVRYAEALRETSRPLVALAYEESYEELVYAHELGHMLDDRIFRKAAGFDRTASFEQFASHISAYATTDSREYMAESFCAFYAGETEHLDPALVELFKGAMK